MGRKSKVVESPHKQRLTLSELAEHDDVCSDVMIDNVRTHSVEAIKLIITSSRLISSLAYGSTDPSTSL